MAVVSLFTRKVYTRYAYLRTFEIIHATVYLSSAKSTRMISLSLSLFFFSIFMLRRLV